MSGARAHRELGLDLRILVDPDRRSYQAAGAKVSVLRELLGPGPLWKGIRRSRAVGVSQGQTIGQPAQVGGVLAVASDGSVAWAHMSRDPSDLPENDDVIQAGH